MALKFKRSKKCVFCGEPDCVEVAITDGGDKVVVRDSKNPEGKTLEYSRSEWRAFIGGVKSGEFDV